MNARRQGNGRGAARGGAGQQRDGLEAVAEDERGLGVVVGHLVELFDRGHLAAFLGDLEAIGETDPEGAHGEGRKGVAAPARPQGRKSVEMEGAGVKEMKQAVIH